MSVCLPSLLLSLVLLQILLCFLQTSTWSAGEILPPLAHIVIFVCYDYMAGKQGYHETLAGGLCGEGWEHKTSSPQGVEVQGSQKTSYRGVRHFKLREGLFKRFFTCLPLLRHVSVLLRGCRTYVTRRVLSKGPTCRTGPSTGMHHGSNVQRCTLLLGHESPLSRRQGEAGPGTSFKSVVISITFVPLVMKIWPTRARIKSPFITANSSTSVSSKYS